jgi:signal transduction histidine kinase
MGQRIERRIAIQYGLAVLVIIGGGAASYLGLVGAIETTRKVVQTHEAHRDLERILSLMKDAETGQRGYVLMEGYQVEQQRLTLLSDLRTQSRALEIASHEAERANRAKSDFLATMSHELRTPMNSIMGCTARLLRKLGDSLAERDLDVLRTVDRNAKHLLNLINDILDLERVPGQHEP